MRPAPTLRARTDGPAAAPRRRRGVAWLAATAAIAVAVVAAPATAAAGGAGDDAAEVCDDPRYRACEVAAERRLVDALDDVRDADGLAPLRSHVGPDTLARAHADALAGEEAGDEGVRTHGGPPTRGDLADLIGVDWDTVREVAAHRADGDLDALVGDVVDDSDAAAAAASAAVSHVGAAVTVDDGGAWVSLVLAGRGEPSDDEERDDRDAARRVDETVAMAVDASRDQWGDGAADAVAVARADDYADALAAAPLIGADGPLLLVPPARHAGWDDPPLPAHVRAEIDRVLGADAGYAAGDDTPRVWVLGGTNAVGGWVAGELSAAYPTERVHGDDRYETAVAAAGRVVDRRGNPDRILVAGGRAWPDAVAGAAVAGARGWPVLLTARDTAPMVATQFADAHPDANVTAVGGETVVGDDAAAALHASRVAGPHRAATSAAVADAFASPPDGADRLDRVVLAPGFAGPAPWAEALVAAPAAARDHAPVLLAGDDLDDSVADYLRRAAPARVDTTPSTPDGAVDDARDAAATRR